MSDLFDKTTKALGASLHLREIRNNVISSNIANAETPGYQAKKVDFEDALARALDLEGMAPMQGAAPEHIAVGPGAISRIKADVYENPDVDVNNDGNTVDMEREMTNLAENSITYKAAVQLISKKLAALKYAVSDGTK
jgi:flagellar basal-body rod protein FlgB